MLSFPLSGSKLNSLEQQRNSPNFIDERLAPSNNPHVIIIKIARQSSIVYDEHTKQWCFPLSSPSASPVVDKSKLIFLGETSAPERRGYFAVESSNVEKEFLKNKCYHTLRKSILLQKTVSLRHQAIIGAAMSLCQWHKMNTHCGSCGGLTDSSKDWGLSRRCLQCKKQFFPQLMPAILVAVLDGKGNVILSQRNKNSKELTILSGFMSHGESAEETVVREVEEETGAKVESLRYIGSQPWPYPNLIMLCYYAVASKSPVLQVEDCELVKVEWVSKEAIKNTIAGKNKDFFIPDRWTAAYCILEPWLSGRVDDYGNPVSHL